MSKVSELSMLALELKKCGEALIGISEGLADMFGGAEEEKQPAKKAAAKKKAAEESKPGERKAADSGRGQIRVCG